MMLILVQVVLMISFLMLDPHLKMIANMVCKSVIGLQRGLSKFLPFATASVLATHLTLNYGIPVIQLSSSEQICMGK